jgi:hypothetical protein
MVALMLGLAGGGPKIFASGSGSMVLAGPFVRKNVVALTLPAEVLAFEISLQSSDDEWENRLRDLEAAHRWLEANAPKSGLRVQTRQAVVLGAAPGKFSSLSSYAGNPELEIKTNLLLLADLTDKSDLVGIVRSARQLLNKVPRAKGVTMRLGEARLGLADAEKYRPELLKKIRAYLDTTAQALGQEVELVISGVDDPVQAQQVEERSVELSLPLRVTYTRKGK